MKIGDRVQYAEESEALGLTEPELCGTITEPTAEDDGGPESVRSVGDVLVAWDDGERFWEDPASLVVVSEVDS